VGEAGGGGEEEQSWRGGKVNCKPWVGGGTAWVLAAKVSGGSSCGGGEAQAGTREAFGGGQEALDTVPEARDSEQEAWYGGQEAWYGGQEAWDGGQEAMPGEGGEGSGRRAGGGQCGSLANEEATLPPS